MSIRINRLKMLAFAALAAGSLVVATPQAGAAQGKNPKAQAKVIGKDKGRDNDDRDGGSDRDGDKNGKGPAFCRSGAGHPVQGRQWCIDRGFGLGSSRWGNAGWGDVVFRRNTSRTGTIGQGTISDVLGSVIFGRLQNQASQLGGGQLTGTWMNSANGPLLLQVQAGGRPIAEFFDRNRDGRAEVVLVNLAR